MAAPSSDEILKQLKDNYEIIKAPNSIRPGTGVDIDKLEYWVQEIDQTYVYHTKDPTLEGVSFKKSYNDSTGLKANNLQDFTVFMPWAGWSSEQVGNRDFPAPLQKATMDVFASVKSDAQAPFIDMATLRPDIDFFNESEKGVSVIDSIIDFINTFKDDSEDSSEEDSPHHFEDNPEEIKKIPIIRFLFGDDDANRNREAAEKYGMDLLTNLFWRSENNVWIPRVNHKKAEIHFGFYNPDFKPGQDAALKFLSGLSDSVANALPKFASTLGQFKPESIGKVLLDHGLRKVSWNHGKVLAVNGKIVMTGGGNYWNAYAAHKEHNNDRKPTDHSIVDHQAIVVGDAAVSAHRWADYFWRYLHNPAKSDHSSVYMKAKLGKKNAKWSRPNLERNALQSPYEYTIERYGKIPILTVAKLGDWHGPMNDIQYPVLIIDGIRDILLNTWWQWIADKSDEALGMSLYTLNLLLGDDAQTYVVNTKSLFVPLKINPAAWASRTSQVRAVAAARTSVIICQQMLVDYLQAKESEWQTEVVQSVNKLLKIEGSPQEWDGFIWPFDLLIAIGQAIGTFYKGNIVNKEWDGVFIILTTKVRNLRPDWEDQTSIARVKMRIARIMKGLPADAGGIPPDQVDGAIEKYLHIRRCLNDNGQMYAHSKIVCVDKKLMYVGSDNLYPSYNEEHGIWVEDNDTVKTWFNGFYKEYWNRCKPVSDDEERKYFADRSKIPDPLKPLYKNQPDGRRIDN